MTTIDSLFVPDLAPALKHPTVLRKFDDLKSRGVLFIDQRS